MHNLGTVFRFEIVRTLKKRSFWVISLMFPVMIGVIAGIIFFSNRATKDASTETAKEKFSIEVTDNSHLIQPAVLKAVGAKEVSQATGMADVQAGKVDAYFYYPANLAKQQVQVYGQDVGIFNDGRYSSVATALLSESVASTVKPNVALILSNKLNINSTTYKNGAPYDGFSQMIAPGIFLFLFYILIVTFGSQMLNSTTEEKENRVIEMILTTIEARTLIVGKIFSLIVLGFIQICIVLIPVIIGYLLLHNQLSLPSFDLSHIPLDPVRILIAFLIFAVSFIMFTGLLVGIGAAAPTAKEASGFFGVVMLLIFGPLYAVTLFVSSPDAGIVQFLSYFPLTAPIPLLLRNAVGNLQIWQAVLALVILVVAAIIIMTLAIRTFRYGALEYSRRLTLKEILRR